MLRLGLQKQILKTRGPLNTYMQNIQYQPDQNEEKVIPSIWLGKRRSIIIILQVVMGSKSKGNFL